MRAAKGQDIRFSKVENNRQPQVEEARNFANKIWNAARFALMNVGEGERVEAEWKPSSALADRWIRAELNDAIEQVTRALEDYRLNEAAQTLYHFFWDDFCDWYIEMAKPLVATRQTTQEARAARSRLLYILETSLRLLHPLMPFLTEEIWQRVPHQGESIMLAPWPEAEASAADDEAKERMQMLIALITKVRSIRSEMNIPVQSRIKLYLGTTGDAVKRLIVENDESIKRLARVEEITITDSVPNLEGAARDVVGGVEIAIPLGGLIDVAKERDRISKEVGRKETEARGLAARLDNLSFLERAPGEVVKQTRERHDELIGEIEKLRSTLNLLGKN